MTNVKFERKGGRTAISRLKYEIKSSSGTSLFKSTVGRMASPGIKLSMFLWVASICAQCLGRSCQTLWPHKLQPAWLLYLWNFPSKNTAVGCHFLLQEIFPTQDWTLVPCIGKLIVYHWATLASNLIPVLERSPGEGNSYTLQYSGLENSIDCIVYGVANSWTWLSDFHFLSLFP